MEHKGQISDLQNSKDRTMFISASKDNTARVRAILGPLFNLVTGNDFYLCPKLFDSDKLELLKTFRTERPVNSASISPIKDHVSEEPTTSEQIQPIQIFF